MENYYMVREIYSFRTEDGEWETRAGDLQWFKRLQRAKGYRNGAEREIYRRIKDNYGECVVKDTSEANGLGRIYELEVVTSPKCVLSTPKEDEEWSYDIVVIHSGDSEKAA